jgi:hypothetical protein
MYQSHNYAARTAPLGGCVSGNDVNMAGAGRIAGGGHGIASMGITGWNTGCTTETARGRAGETAGEIAGETAGDTDRGVVGRFAWGSAVRSAGRVPVSIWVLWTMRPRVGTLSR